MTTYANGNDRARNEIPSQLRTQHCQLHEMEMNWRSWMREKTKLEMSHDHEIIFLPNHKQKSTTLKLGTVDISIFFRRTKLEDAKSLEMISWELNSVCNFQWKCKLSFYQENETLWRQKYPQCDYVNLQYLKFGIK